MPLAVVFPGQGAQHAAMGAVWRDHPCWTIVERAEEALDEPVAHLLLDENPAVLAGTRAAQIAVFVHSLVTWDAARPILCEPIVFAGHSLGQLTALVAAGVIGFDEGVRSVAQRGTFTEAAAHARPGEMVALLGADAGVAEAAMVVAPDACWLANDNAPGQIVVAGTPRGVGDVSNRARELGVRRAVRLNVAGAFHTPLMDEAARQFAHHLADVPFAAPSASVVSNENAQPYGDGEGWRPRLVDHLVRPVRWRQTMERFAALGVTELVEIGPGSTLTALARRTLPDVTGRAISTPGDVGILQPRPIVLGAEAVARATTFAPRTAGREVIL